MTCDLDMAQAEPNFALSNVVCAYKFIYKFISQISDLHKVNNKRIYKYNKHIRGYGDDKIETITNIRKQ